MKKKYFLLLLVLLLAVAAGTAAYCRWLAPTRILVVNALDAQQADIVLSNDSRHIHVDCVTAEQMQSLRGYDAVIIYARRIFLNEDQVAEVKRAAAEGVPVFTKALRSNDFVENHNLSAQQIATLQEYFDNENRQNLRNGLRYLRHLATPHRWGDQDFDHPIAPLQNVYYYREYGKYGTVPLSPPEGGRPTLALISGITFPMEGNREHIDTLFTMLTQRGFNVVGLSAVGKERERMLHELHPDAIVYLAMGRIGNDTLVSWLHEQNIPLFAPFPLSCSHEDWMNPRQPLSNGSKNARIVIPEIDGGIAPYCVGTQNPSPDGYLMRTAEVERCEAFSDYVSRYMALRTKPNSEKRIAIGYFKRPGKDALLASGMEVIPSLYNFLRRLRQEGYDVSGLPPTLSEFTDQVRRQGLVLGDYAEGAQQQFMDEGHPLWLSRQQYEQWAAEVITKEKYEEVVEHYGEFPGFPRLGQGGRGSFMARGDSMAVACLRYGNVLLFPQPRPALGDDDFRVEHGVDVAPPHSYLAPYLYMQRGFQADALVHFGTHGNLEYTPGRDAAMRREDWSQQLVGPTPHFYFYATGNIGEAIIAKRRSAAALVTYLTPPYAESGMRQKYEQLHKLSEELRVKSEEFATAPVPADDSKAVANSSLFTLHSSLLTLHSSLRKALVREGLHRALGLDSLSTEPFTQEELECIDTHLEELMNEKMQGAYYTLGQPYSADELDATARAMSDDPAEWPHIKELLLASTQAEMDNMVGALSGHALAPAPGGDPVMNANVLPTGRNMFSINPENTPDERAWEDGRRLADETLERYRRQHDGQWPEKVSYTLWAGEFIATGGATIAQALWMMGVEPERDSQGRIGSLRVVPAEELGRPRIDIVIQISGQLRDIAASRLELISTAVRMVSSLGDEEKLYTNYVWQGTQAQQQELTERGIAPDEARQLSTLRIFGPANSGYSTGMMDYIERSGTWDERSELVDGYLNNMCAAYGDQEHWGMMRPELFSSALQRTAVTVQPRQSNTWGPLSLDHVYEFTGGMSMAVRQLSGREPDAVMADYRNPRRRRLQGLREAIDVEARTTLLNPVFIRERMKGDEGTAQMFGESFRNVFGWNVTRPSSLDPQLYDELYDMYIVDREQLGIREFFEQKNPAALQAMTAVMLESARKGYWQPTPQQLQTTMRLHTDLTRDHGPACTDFVCNNPKLQQYIAGNVPEQVARQYNDQMAQAKSTALEPSLVSTQPDSAPAERSPWPVAGLVVVLLIVLASVVAYLKKKS
ncbi:MAG: cobaltochelatase subunit CobN [Prevotella sp.]|nr:cobaltochelatase subunit CobN [Prevotella sp.]